MKVGGEGRGAAAEKGRGQFIASFVCPDKKARCFPVGNEAVRVKTRNILEKPSFFKD